MIKLERKARDFAVTKDSPMSQTLVLSIGSDLAVLDTRDLILRSAAYVVVSAISIEEAVRFFQDGDFDLIVLCHTLPLKDSERLTCFIRASGSRIPIVCVSGTVHREHNAFADATLDQGPVEFLGSLVELLSKHAPMQPLGVSARHNHGEVAWAKKVPGSRSSTGFDRREREMQDNQGVLSFLERTRERVPSH